MKRIMFIAVIMAMVLLLQPMQVFAASDTNFEVTLSKNAPQPGELVTLTVSLTGYTAQTTDAIRGMQVDIDGIDQQMMEVVSYRSAIADDSAVSNLASYNKTQGRVRLMYVRTEGTLPAPCTDVLRVELRIRDDLSGVGSIQLPVTVKLQTVSKQITLTKTCTVQQKLLGDVTGDGKVTATDYSRLLAHVKKVDLITDEATLKVADVTGDGKVTATDYSRLLAHVKKVDPLW